MQSNDQGQMEASPEASQVESGLGEPVETGFGEPVSQPEQNPLPEEVVAKEDTVTVTPVSTEPIVFANQREAAEQTYRDEQEQKKRDFTHAVLEARKPVEQPIVLSPVAPRIIEQTSAEMEAGRKMNDHHAGLQARRPQGPPPAASEGTMTPVFRPADYVPDPKKGQGVIQSRNLSV